MNQNFCIKDLEIIIFIINGKRNFILCTYSSLILCFPFLLSVNQKVMKNCFNTISVTVRIKSCKKKKTQQTYKHKPNQKKTQKNKNPQQNTP